MSDRELALINYATTALELAEWIPGRKPGLRLIDLRSAREFDTYHLPSPSA